MSLTHIHLFMNHIPVIGALIGIALLVYAWTRRSSEAAKISLALFAALAAIAVIVFLTGEPAEEAVEHLPGFSGDITEEHEDMARVATIAIVGFGALAIAALAYYRKRVLPRWVAAAALVMSLTIGGLMAATANLGGQIRHSEIRPGGVTATSESHREDAER